jgi:putative Mg2+ transporter-C (MgtC) family protein
MELDWLLLKDIFIKLGLALICGGVLGIERERRNRPAGFRTYMLVCIGSTLVMATNYYIFDAFQTGDPSRMAAQVVSGLGFLGAGTIVTAANSKVKGLTTAAGLWSAGGIGLAIGIGFYEGAIVGTAMIFIAMVLLHSMDGLIMSTNKLVMVHVEFEHFFALKNFINVVKSNNVKILDIESKDASGAKNNQTAALITLKLPDKKMHKELMEILSKAEGMTHFEEV